MSEPTGRTDGGRERGTGADEDSGEHGDGDGTADDRTGEARPADEDESIEELLRSAGVLRETRDGTDVRLTDQFERAWHERIRQMRGGNRALRWLAASRGIEPDALAVADGDGRFVVTHDGSTVGEWHSEASFLADIVAESTVKEFCDPDRLDGLPADARRELSARLCMCLERCPACDAELAFVEDASGDGNVAVSLECPDCGATVAGGSYAVADEGDNSRE